MGVVIRSPSRHRIEKDDCKCFMLEKDNYLCFRKNFTGALSDDQEQKYCTPKSFVPEKEGGFAKTPDSPESKNILRTIGMFTKGVKVAKREYEESGQRSIPYWQNVVKHKVDDVYLHPAVSHPKTETRTPEIKKNEAQEAQVREKITKNPLRPPESSDFLSRVDWKGNRERRMAKEGRTPVVNKDEEPDERRFMTPETIRALTEANKKRLSHSDVEAISDIARPTDDDRVDRIVSRLDYRYHRDED